MKPLMGLCCMIFFAVFSLAAPAIGVEQQPNIILVTVESLRADFIGTYGSHQSLTPTLDKLAVGGVVYAEAMTTSCQSLPSMVSLFTSLYPAQSTVTTDKGILHTRATTLAELLHEYGYATAAITTAIFTLRCNNGLNQGFDFYNQPISKPVKKAIEKQNIHLNASKNSNRHLMLNQPKEGIDPRKIKNAAQVTDNAIRWLNRYQSKNTDKPFFLWLHYFDPHQPYAARINSCSDYDDVRCSYASDVAYLDHNLARLLRELDTQGMVDNTLIVVTANHGESLGERQALGHNNNLFDEVLKIPLIFYYPKRLQPCLVSRFTVSIMDIMPTILDMLGIESRTSTAQSLNLKAPKAQGKDRVIISDSGAGMLCVRGHGYKIIYSYDNQGGYLLPTSLKKLSKAIYDLSSDPSEQRPFNKPMNGHLNILENSLKDWLENTHPRFPRLFQTDPQILELIKGL